MRCALRHATMALTATVMGCGGLVAGPDPATDPESVFEAAWRDVDRHYAFFEYNQLDWSAIYSQYRPLVKRNTTERQLWTTLCALVAEQRSFHASLSSPLGGCGRPWIQVATNYNRALVSAALQSGRKSTGHIDYGLLGDDIGYVFVPSFEDEFQGEFESVLRALDGVGALVIDIRNNGGGNDGNGHSIAARLTSEARTYQLTRYRNGPGHGDFTQEVKKTLRPSSGPHFDGPVALVTNRYNGSASEDFITMMRVIPTVFTVGDTSIGNSSNPLWRELPNGWQMMIPQSIQMTPERFIIEGRGLPPTFPVMLDSADVDRGVDTILEFAIRELRKRIAG